MSTETNREAGRTPSASATKGYKGMGMDGIVATRYARITRKNLEDYRKDARRVAGLVPEGAAVLELAPGPGYLAVELAGMGRYRVAGLDISAKLVEIAQANAREAGVDVDFRQGNGAQMPYEDATFDFVVCRAAFKNFSEPVRTLDEMHRVLRPGGRALIDDLRKDVSNEEIDRLVKDDLKLTGINRLITKLTFKNMLVKRAYTADELRAMAAQSRFGTCQIEQRTVAIEVWLEK